MKSKIRLLQTKWNDSGLQLKIVIVFILTISAIVFTNLILYLNINSMLEQVDRIYVSNVIIWIQRVLMHWIPTTVVSRNIVRFSTSLTGKYPVTKC